MEPVETKVDEPFGRQPMPVTVTVTGDPVDAVYYKTILQRYVMRVEDVMSLDSTSFRIFPRAVND